MKITGAYGGASFGGLSSLENTGKKTEKEVSTGKKVTTAADNA